MVKIRSKFLNKSIILICLLCLSFLLYLSCTLINNNFNISQSVFSYNTDDKSIVYLTFDDGPIPKVTDAILDVLKDYNIKGTFFVVGKEVDGREKILCRIYDEGHSIGLHTYSHNSKKIYSSEHAFIEEMLKTRKKVKDVIGCDVNIIRFPWGTYNKYYHINNHMINSLHQNNFKIYDWNSSIEDGRYPNLSVEQLTRNSKKVKNDCNDYKDIIILMHTNFNNTNTVKALPLIIEHYKKLGYEFKKITEETPEYYYECNRKH